MSTFNTLPAYKFTIGITTPTFLFLVRLFTTFAAKRVGRYIVPSQGDENLMIFRDD